MKNLRIFLFLLSSLPFCLSGNVSLIMPNMTGAPGTQVTVPVKVKDFLTIVSCQGTIQFDQTKVSYVSVQNYGLPGMNASSFGTTQVSSGKLTFLWYDGTLAGVNLADSSVIFSITFNLIGTEGQTSPLTFVNSPTTVEIVDVNFNTLTTTIVNGSIYIHTTTVINDVSLYLDNISGTAGSQVTVSFRADDFTNIISAQGTVQFDPADLSYSSVSAYGLPGMNSSNFGTTQISSGKLTFLWYDGTLAGVDVADGTALFTITFDVLCNTGPTSVSLTNSPAAVEITDSLFNVLNTIETAGSVNVQGLSITASANPATICEGQASSLSATGATSYAWSPGSLSGSPVTVSPTSNTVYSVVGTSNGCTSTAYVTVTVNTLPNVSAGNDITICEGEQVTLTGSGAVTYTWNNSVINNVAFTPSVGSTTYTVTGTTSGCSNTDQVTVTVNEKPNLTVNTVNASCGNADGSATVTASGGTGTYTYLWSTNAGSQTSATAGSLGAGIYYATVNDGNCSEVTTANVSENGAPAVTLNASSNVICYGDTVTLTAGGADSYSWSPSDSLSQTTGASVNANPSSDITYTVIGTTAGCSSYQTVAITVNPLPVAGFDYALNGFQISMTDTSENATSYYWDFGDGTTSTDQNPIHDYLTEGPFTIMQVTTNNCSSDTAYTNILITGNPMLNSDINFSLYPNPTNGIFRISTATIDNLDVTIMNSVGIQLSETIYTIANSDINISNLSSGVYFVRITYNNNSHVFKIVKF